MKKIITLLLIAGLAACVSTPGDSPHRKKEGFSVDDARDYFEKNAEMLTYAPSLHDMAGTRSGELPELLLTPIWSAASSYSSGDMEVVNVPVGSTPDLYVLRHDLVGGETKKRSSSVAETRMVITRTGDAVRMFLTTMVPEYSYQLKASNNTKVYHPGHDFRGLIFFSQLNGSGEEIWEYYDGVRGRRIKRGPSAHERNAAKAHAHGPDCDHAHSSECAPAIDPAYEEIMLWVAPIQTVTTRHAMDIDMEEIVVTDKPVCYICAEKGHHWIDCPIITAERCPKCGHLIDDCWCRPYVPIDGDGGGNYGGNPGPGPNPDPEPEPEPEPEPNDEGIIPVTSVEIKVSTWGAVSLGTQYGLSIKKIPENATEWISQVHYRIGTVGSTYQYVGSQAGEARCTVMAKHIGEYVYSAEVHLGLDLQRVIMTNISEPVTHVYPSANEVYNRFSSDMIALWNESKKAGTLANTYEYAAVMWIDTRENATELWEFESVKSDPYSYDRRGNYIAPFHKLNLNSDYDFVDHTKGGRWPIGYVHTHPSWDKAGTNIRQAGRSNDDQDPTNGVPAWVIDYEPDGRTQLGIPTISSKGAERAGYKIERYGGNGRRS